MRKPGSSPAQAPVVMTGDERLALSALGAIVLITAGWWALALWPLQASPEWLARTRAVCFGVAPGGLPDGGGWILLIGQPLSMLGFLLIVWGGTVRRALVCTLSRPAGRVALAGVAVAVVAGFTGAGARVVSVAMEPAYIPPSASAADWPRLDRDAPALPLVDQHGRQFDLARLRGRPVLLTFAFAHCETVCPAIVDQVLVARNRARPGAAVVVVSIDPWRDTPSRLPSIAERWQLGAGDYVLSGTIDDVQSVAEAWNVPITRDPDTGVVDHPAIVYIIGRDGRIRYGATGGVDLLADLLRRG